jgi:hypothetical protein
MESGKNKEIDASGTLQKEHIPGDTLVVAHGSCVEFLTSRTL